MKQYIDKAAVVAKIKKEIKDIYAGREYVGIPSWEEREINGLEKAIKILNTIEVKDVDLEKEIELIKGDYEQVDVAWNNDFDFIARHFYELGLKSKNE